MMQIACETYNNAPAEVDCTEAMGDAFIAALAGRVVVPREATEATLEDLSKFYRDVIGAATDKDDTP
jgi:hypothetical protein